MENLLEIFLEVQAYKHHHPYPYFYENVKGYILSLEMFRNEITYTYNVDLAIGSRL